VARLALRGELVFVINNLRGLSRRLVAAPRQHINSLRQIGRNSLRHFSLTACAAYQQARKAMKLLSASIAIALLSAVGFSALYDRVLNGPSLATPERFTDNPNHIETGDPSWASRWTVGAKV
jgi:hypothetical protein